jgi:uncharacterized protein (DUF2267 family)
MAERHSQAELSPRRRIEREVERRAPVLPLMNLDDAISAVMCTLTERLTAGEDHRLLDALPLSIQPWFERCVRHRDRQVVEKLDRAEFLDRIAHHLGITPAHAEALCTGVFAAIRAEIPPKLVEDIATQLPHGIEELWLSEIARRPVSTATRDAARESFERDVETGLPRLEDIPVANTISAVMSALFERLSGGEARALFLSLPESVRPLVDSTLLDRSEAAERFDIEEFVARIAGDLACSRSDAEAIARTVFRAVHRVIPRKQIEDVASQLPPRVRELWLAP